MPSVICAILATCVQRGAVCDAEAVAQGIALWHVCDWEEDFAQIFRYSLTNIRFCGRGQFSVSLSVKIDRRNRLKRRDLGCTKSITRNDL